METRSQMVTRTLRNGILNGDYPGGSRMNENDIAVALGVSRTPIRSALSTLAAEGLLNYTPNSGYAVRSYTSSDISAIYDVRMTLEGLAARLAAERGLSDAARGMMHRVLAESAELTETSEWTDEIRAKWTDLNDRFHQIIYDTADNFYLLSMIQMARDVPILGLIRFHWFDADFMARNHQDHIEVADAIFNRQPIRAEALEREHVYKNGRRLVQQWRKVEARRPSVKPARGRAA